MKRLQNRRPSPALIVAMLALLIGLTGVATGAKSRLPAGSVTARELASNAVHRAEMANNAVGTKELAGNAVGPADLAQGSVTSRSIAPGAVTETGLAAGAVSNSKIKDDAVSTRTLQNGAVTTEIVAPGAIPPSRLGQFPSVRLTMAADFNVPDNPFWEVPWNTEVYDTGDMHDQVVNPGQIHFPTPGIYRITVSWEWTAASSVVGTRQIGIYKNNSIDDADVVGSRYDYNVPVGLKLFQTLSVAYAFNAGDYISVYATHTSTAETLKLAKRAGASPIFTAEWVAPLP